MKPVVMLVSGLVTLVVVATACTSNPQAADTMPAEPLPTAVTSTTTTSTSTTTQPPAPPMTVSGVPDDLARLIESLYDFAAGTGRPAIDPAYLPTEGVARGMAGRGAHGGTATLSGVEVALVAAGSDLIAAVDRGEGWEIVAVELPSLGHRNLGYESAVVAVVGSDARPGEDPLTARADSLHLVGFDGAMATLDIVGIPRDSWVQVPGAGSTKLTNTLASGGPDRLRATLEHLAGYAFDGMVLTGFEGFMEAVGSVLGGIQIDVPQRMVDSASGADFSPGEQYMNGPQALAFARARKTLRLGDLDRQRNGGLVVIAAVATAQHRDIAVTPQLLAAATEWGWTDLDPVMILRLAMTARIASVLEIGNEVLPGVPGERAGASTIELTSGARPLLADLADGSLRH